MEGKGKGGEREGREEREEKGKGGGKGPSPPPEKKSWRRHSAPTVICISLRMMLSFTGTLNTLRTRIFLQLAINASVVREMAVKS